MEKISKYISFDNWLFINWLFLFRDFSVGFASDEFAG